MTLARSLKQKVISFFARCKTSALLAAEYVLPHKAQLRLVAAEVGWPLKSRYTTLASEGFDKVCLEFFLLLLGDTETVHVDCCRLPCIASVQGCKHTKCEKYTVVNSAALSH
jgi:hypothetical protein